MVYTRTEISKSGGNSIGSGSGSGCSYEWVFGRKVCFSCWSRVVSGVVA